MHWCQGPGLPCSLITLLKASFSAELVNLTEGGNQNPKLRFPKKGIKFMQSGAVQYFDKHLTYFGMALVAC